MIRDKKQIITVICVLALVMLLGSITYAFFNYTRVGAINNLGTGRISFNSEQNGRLNMTNLFPMTSSEIEEANLDIVTVGIQGDTTFEDGEEFEIKLVDVTNTVNGKSIPISYIATYNANTGGSIGEASNDYYSERESKNSNIYLLDARGEISENKRVLVGYIKSGATGVNGTLSIKAYIDAERMAITDTEDENSEWINGREVFTTSEWNSLNSTPISFKIRVESNEGIWVTGSENLGNKIKERLGNDGVVAVNTNGDLYTGTGTIREYRYSGIGNYCTYTDGTNNYNISVEGTDCLEHAYKGVNGYIAIGSNDVITMWGDQGGMELTRVGTTAVDSGLKNYVMFNNEKWRIIGVFGDNVKIMKDLPLIDNITNNPVDTEGLNGASPNTNQIYTNILNEKYLIRYLAYSVNYRYGYYHYNYPADTTYPHNGSDWTHSGLMYYLNETNTGSYYNTIGASYRALIDDTTYYLGNVSILAGDVSGWWVVDGMAKEVYEQEHGSVECAASVTDMSQNSNCNIWNGNSATWRGKIGILYPSDYAYAASTDMWNTNEGAYYYNGGSFSNWMFNSGAGGSWMISPASNLPGNVIALIAPGATADYNTFNSYAVRPVLNLRSETETTGGDGSFEDPYILKIE